MPRFLAIDTDSHGLTVATGNVRGGVVKLEQVVGSLDASQPLSPSTAKSLGLQLATLLKQANIAPAPVLLAIGRDRIVLKEIKHPPSAPQDEPAMVRFQAIKELTDSPEDGVLDYVPISSGNAVGERRSMVTFIHKDQFAAAKDLCDAAGLKLEALTPRPYANVAALQRAITAGGLPVPDAPDAALGVLTLNHTSGEFSVVKSGVLRFSRPVSAIALGSEASLVAEMRRNLAIYASQSSGDAVQGIYLAEGELGAQGWSGRLGASLPVPVIPFDPLVGTEPADRTPPQQRGRFTSVVGLLASQANVKQPSPNFIKPRQPKAEVNPNRNRAAAVVLLALLLISAAGFFGYMMVKKEADKTAQIRERVRDLESQLKLLEPDMERVAVVEELDKRNIPWLDEIYQLAALFPNNSNMKVMTYNADIIPPTERKGGTARPGQPGAARPGTPTSPPTPGTAPRPGGTTSVNAPLTPVAKIQITLATEDSRLVESLVKSMSNESSYYVKVNQRGGQLIRDASSGKQQQQITIDAQLVKRPPTEYKERVRVALPKPADKRDRGAAPDADPNNVDPNEIPGGAFPGPDGGFPRE